MKMGFTNHRNKMLPRAWLSLMACTAAMTVHASDTTLTDAAMRGDAARMEALLQAGADPNVAGQFGTPALHWRVEADDLAGVRRLLKAGADVNGQTERGITPLMLAIARGNAAMVEILLR